MPTWVSDLALCGLIVAMGLSAFIILMRRPAPKDWESEWP